MLIVCFSIVLYCLPAIPTRLPILGFKVSSPLAPSHETAAVQMSLQKDYCNRGPGFGLRCGTAFRCGTRLMEAGGARREREGSRLPALCCDHLHWSTLLYSNPLVSSEPQVCPIGIVGVFEEESVDLNILWGLVQLSSIPNAMIREFWHSR